MATFETSLYDEWGARRKDFGLADLFGASFDGRLEGPMQNSYLTLQPDPVTGKFHSLLTGIEDATRIINGVNRVVVKGALDAGPSPLTVVPSYPDLPMEEVYVRPSTRKDPGVFLREVGKARVVYFPFDIDRTFWEILCVDHGKVLRNAVLWAARGNRTGYSAWTGSIGFGSLDSSEFHDRPLGESDESHDDERPRSRNYPDLFAGA